MMSTVRWFLTALCFMVPNTSRANGGVITETMIAACTSSNSEDVRACNIYFSGFINGIYALAVKQLKDQGSEYQNDPDFIGLNVGFCKLGDYEIDEFVSVFVSHALERPFTQSLATPVVAMNAWTERWPCIFD